MVGLLRAGIDMGQTFGGGGVHTEVGVQVKVLEAMDGIVDLRVADEAECVVLVVILVQGGDRVHRGQLGRTAFAVLDGVITVHTIIVIDGLRGVEHGRSADGTGVGIPGMHVGLLRAQVVKQDPVSLAAAHDMIIFLIHVYAVCRVHRPCTI